MELATLRNPISTSINIPSSICSRVTQAHVCTTLEPAATETLTVAPSCAPSAHIFLAISSTAGRFLMLGSRFRIPSIIRAVGAVGAVGFGFILLGGIDGTNSLGTSSQRARLGVFRIDLNEVFSDYKQPPDVYICIYIYICIYTSISTVGSSFHLIIIFLRRSVPFPQHFRTSSPPVVSTCSAKSFCRTSAASSWTSPRRSPTTALTKSATKGLETWLDTWDVETENAVYNGKNFIIKENNAEHQFIEMTQRK